MTMTDILRPAEAAMDQVAARPRSAVFWLALVSLAMFLPGFFNLQPMDRDEPHFAQATKQMLESHDFVSIRLQDQARNQKPVGIYWLQAGAVAAGEALGLGDARRTIWLYRLPSLAGGLASVLLTYWTALAFGSRRAAFLAGLLFASTVLIGVEARLAKTDAVVTATVVAAMGVLARLYLGKAQAGAGATRDAASGSLGLGPPTFFWAAIGFGILLKGPITPMVPAFAAAALVAKDRAWRWLARLRPLFGLAFILVIIAPWLVLIMLATHGAFLSDSVGGDLLTKMAGPQKLHGYPPGGFLAVFPVTGWPMAPFTILAAPFAWQQRREPTIAFLLAWIVPCWLVFEAVPFKLVHYVLPLYPALAILTALAIDRGALALDRGRGRWVMLLVPLIAFVLAVAGGVLAFVLGTMPGWLYFVVLPFLLWQIIRWIGLLSASRRGEDRAAPAVAGAALIAFLVYVMVFSGLLTTSFFAPFAVSPRLAAAWRQASAAAPACRRLAVAAAGYTELSLVFLTATDTRLIDGKGAGEFLAAGPCRLAFVEARQEPAFKAALGAAPDVRLAERVKGIDLNGFARQDIGVYVRAGAAP